MTDDEQLAESLKYSSAHVWHVAELSPGLFALYTYERKPALITRDWDEVLQVYRARPTYVPRPLRPTTGIDLTKLEFTI